MNQDLNTHSSDDEMMEGLCPEAMEDYFRIEARQWLLENGERLFIDKLRMIIEIR